MGPLEYQAMLSFRDVADDGVLCTFSSKSSRLGQMVWSVGQAAWTVHYVEKSLSSSQQGGPPC
jgi:hypothetical protein